MIQKAFILYFYLRAKLLRRFRSREALENWQEKKVRSFLRRILPKSKFYRDRFESLVGSLGVEGGVENWRRLPVIDKKQMMEHLSELNTSGIDREEAFAIATRAEETRDFSPMIGKITVGLSSGTSGSRGLFLVSPMERYTHAGTIMAKILPGSILERNRVAFFLRASSNLYSTSKGSRLDFRFFDLLQPLEEHLASLQKYQPTLLIAPPSMLRMLADAQAAGKVALRPRKIVSVAEVLDPMDQRAIEKSFARIVHQVYQCTEGFLGVTCRLGKLHLNEDLVVIEKEYIDRSLGKFYPIITDFTRTTQPIIRYRLNDILTESPAPCACGSVLTALESIEGRSDDLLVFSDGKDPSRSKTVFPDFIRRAIMTSDEKIEEYQVIQSRPGELVIALRSTDLPGSEKKSADKTRAMLKELGCADPEIRFEHVFQPLRGKKLQRVKRTFQLDTLIK